MSCPNGMLFLGMFTVPTTNSDLFGDGKAVSQVIVTHCSTFRSIYVLSVALCYAVAQVLVLPLFYQRFASLVTYVVQDSKD